MRRTITLAACLATLVPASLAWSQQEPAAQPAPNQSQRQDQPRTERQTRPAGQAQPAGQAPRTGQAQPGGQAPRAAAEADRNLSQLATVLALGNKAEIELGQLAAQKSTNDDVRSFAQKMVEDHTAALQKLAPFKPQVPSANGNRKRLEAAGEQQRAAQPKPRQTAAGRPVADGKPVRLPAVTREAAQNRLAMTKQLLSKYEAQDFDMGYLGQQIIAHIDMLAHLQAMQGAGSPEFQQVVEEGIQTTTEHLDLAKTLAMQLEGKERGDTSPDNPGVRRTE